MPCTTDYIEPSKRSKELRRAAKLLIYIRERIGGDVESWLLSEAANEHASDDRSVTELCAALKEMTPELLDQVVYDARSREARDLADWWEDHQAADAERERNEAASEAARELRESGLGKLSQTERKALGL